MPLLTSRFTGIAGLASASLLSGLLLSSVVKAADAEDAIEYRQSVFHTLAWQFGAMAAMVKGEKDYDAAEFQMRAERLAVLAQMPWEGFVKGSFEGDTRALGKIEAERADFDEHAQALMEESQTLAELSSTQDLAKLRSQFAATAKTCKGCHQEYRGD